MIVETARLDYKERLIEYNKPLGIYLDGKMTGRIHDDILPKYYHISIEKLALYEIEDIKLVRDASKRQLEKMALGSFEEARNSLQNTLDLTNSMLEQN